MGSACCSSATHLFGTHCSLEPSAVAAVRPQDAGSALVAGSGYLVVTPPNGHLVSAVAAVGLDIVRPNEGARGNLAAHDVDGRQKDILRQQLSVPNLSGVGNLGKLLSEGVNRNT